MDFLALCKIAIEAALSAGKIIQQFKTEDIVTTTKKAGESIYSQVVTNIDIKCEKTILSHLLPSCMNFNLGILSEELPDNGSRFKKEFFWCIDPLDGTHAFANGYNGYTISIALVSKSGISHIGVVYDPSTTNLYHAIKGQGAFKNNDKWDVSTKNRFLTYVTDKKLEDTPYKLKIRKILEHKVQKLNLENYKELSGGGAVLNAIRVAENSPSCLIKLPKKEKGGGSIWDYAATACLFHELGLQATDFKGRQLDLNRKKSTFMNQEGVFYSHW